MEHRRVVDVRRERGDVALRGDRRVEAVADVGLGRGRGHRPRGGRGDVRVGGAGEGRGGGVGGGRGAAVAGGARGRVAGDPGVDRGEVRSVERGVRRLRHRPHGVVDASFDELVDGLRRIGDGGGDEVRVGDEGHRRAEGGRRAVALAAVGREDRVDVAGEGGAGRDWGVAAVGEEGDAAAAAGDGRRGSSAGRGARPVLRSGGRAGGAGAEEHGEERDANRAHGAHGEPAARMRKARGGGHPRAYASGQSCLPDTRRSTSGRLVRCGVRARSLTQARRLPSGWHAVAPVGDAAIAWVAVPRRRTLDAKDELLGARTALFEVVARSRGPQHSVSPCKKARPLLGSLHEPCGDGVGDHTSDLLIDVSVGDEPHVVARLGGPEILPLTLGCIEGLRREAVKLSQEDRQHAVRVRHDEMMVIRHDADRMHADTGALGGEREAVGEDSRRLRARTETKGALVAAPRDEVGFARDDTTRMGHDAPGSERHANLRSRFVRGNAERRRGPGERPDFCVTGATRATCPQT